MKTFAGNESSWRHELTSIGSLVRRRKRRRRCRRGRRRRQHRHRHVRRTQLRAAEALHRTGPVEQVGQGPDVGLRHLQRLELGQLVVAAEVGDDFPESLEGVIEAVHATTFAGVGGDATFTQNGGRRRPEKKTRIWFSRRSRCWRHRELAWKCGRLRSHPGVYPMNGLETCIYELVNTSAFILTCCHYCCQIHLAHDGFHF